MTNAEPIPTCLHCGKAIRATGIESCPWIHIGSAMEACGQPELGRPDGARREWSALTDPAPASDPVAARLAEIRENHAETEPARALPDLTDRADVFYSSVMDVPPLLAAVEAARKLAGEWDETATALDASAARATERGAMPFRTDQMAERAQAHRDDAKALRARIARELLGEDDHD